MDGEEHMKSAVWCYGFDLKCPPKAEMFVPSEVLVRGGRKFKRQGLVGGLRDIEGRHSKGIV